MAIEKTSHLYEVLIRFDEKGYKGSHVRDLERVLDTQSGELFSEREGDARPVTLDECRDLLGAAVAAAIEDMDAAVAARTAELAGLAEAATARAEAAEAAQTAAEERLRRIAECASGATA